MSPKAYTFISDLAGEASVPPRGIHSQTLSDESGVELVLFAMAAGERLSEHTSSRPAIVHALSGSGTLLVDGDEYPLQAGAWLRMSSRTAHAIATDEGLVFALYLLQAS